jgi:hypothetical protein
MNQKELIAIDDDSLEQVAGGFGILSCLVAKPLQLVGSVVHGALNLLFGSCKKC